MSSQPVRTRTIGGAAQLLLREQGDLVELIAGNLVLLSSAALATEVTCPGYFNLKLST